MDSIGFAGCYRWCRKQAGWGWRIVAPVSRKTFIITVDEIGGRVKHFGNEIRILKNGSLLTNEFSILDGEFVDFVAGNEVEL